MENRTKNIEQLLMWSRLLDEKESDFNNKMYNKVLSNIKKIDVINESEQYKLSDEIIKKTGLFYRLSEDYYKNKIRLREYVTARYIAMHLIKENTNLSLKKIGNLFGGKDHATVIYGLKTLIDLRKTDKILNSQVEDLQFSL